jgi:23S rRNA (pseudouridine1915-N3)-methyltransferase
VALCVEGKQMPSEGMAALIAARESSGKPKLCFVIGGSYGLAPAVKARADRRLSMSEMTFPHHLARVMLIEQVYRGFKINEGSQYHK